MKKFFAPRTQPMPSIGARLGNYLPIVLYSIISQEYIGWVTRRQLPDQFTSSLSFHLAILAWACALYVLLVVLPSKWLRRIVSVVSIVAVSVLVLVDAFLLKAYQTPYIDSMAMPLLTTNMGETQAFLTTILSHALGLLVHLFALVGIGLASWLLPKFVVRLMRWIGSKYKTHGSPTWTRRIPWLTLGISLSLILGIVHYGSVLIGYRHHWVRYDVMTLAERLNIGTLMARKEIRRSQYDQPRLQAVDPHCVAQKSILPQHNLVIALADRLYPVFMHCYGHYLGNTPQIDSLLQQGELILFDRVYAPDRPSSDEAMYDICTLPSDGAIRQSLTSLLEVVGYRSYWLSNHNKVEPWINYTPRLQMACDSSFYTHLRGSEEYWNKRIPDDHALLDHLDFAHRNPSQSLVEVIHLLGARESIWQRVSDEYKKYDRRHLSEKGIREEKQELYAEYCNVIYSMDAWLGKIVASYQHHPTLLFFMGNTGWGEEHMPYTEEVWSPQEKHRVPMFCYISPELKRQVPQLESRVRALSQTTLRLDELPQWLSQLLDVRYLPHAVPTSSAPASPRN